MVTLTQELASQSWMREWANEQDQRMLLLMPEWFPHLLAVGQVQFLQSNPLPFHYHKWSKLSKRR